MTEQWQEGKGASGGKEEEEAGGGGYGKYTVTLDSLHKTVPPVNAKNAHPYTSKGVAVSIRHL